MREVPINFTAVRTELRALSRGSLLIIAERAVELMPEAQLNTLLDDFVRLTVLPHASAYAPVSLLGEVLGFHAAAMAGDYYDTIDINNRGVQEQSKGTDAFIAEFHRLLHHLIHAADQEGPLEICDSFRLLFGLLSEIDQGNDNVLFFADDGSSSNVGVNWRAALPAYFRRLAKASTPEQFARAVDEAVAGVVTCDRPWYLGAARHVATDAQRNALDTLMT